MILLARPPSSRHQFIEQLLGFYREGRLTLGALANLAGRSVVEIVGDLSVSGNIRIRSSSGIPSNAKEELSKVSQSDALAMDMTALFTVSVLDFLERLPKGFKRICVAQGLLDEIDESLVRDFGKLRTATTIGKADGKYYRHELTTEQLNYRRQLLEKIGDFAKSSCEILPVKAALDINRTNYENTRLLLGKGSLASILIAKDQGIPFYSDDLSLRILARNDWQVDGVWSQTILKHLKGQGVIAEEEYHHSVVKLLRGNFWFVPLELADAVWTLDEFQMRITPEVLRVFEALQGPDCDEDSAVVLSAKLLKQVWVASLVGGQRLMILDLALSSLTTGRDPRRAITKLNSLLQGEFTYHPIALNEIQNTIVLWVNQRSLHI